MEWPCGLPSTPCPDPLASMMRASHQCDAVRTPTSVCVLFSFLMIGRTSHRITSNCVGKKSPPCTMLVTQLITRVSASALAPAVFDRPATSEGMSRAVMFMLQPCVGELPPTTRPKGRNTSYYRYLCLIGGRDLDPSDGPATACRASTLRNLGARRAAVCS